ncbi:MAG: hypothetical protein ACMUIG_07575 [Thermoplasmatota archaeon]
MSMDLKDLWENLTLAIPGMVTYGSWRLLILLTGYDKIDFSEVDGSILLTASIIIAIAAIQQLFGIFLEIIACGILLRMKNRDRIARCLYDRKLFLDRFKNRGSSPYREPVRKRIAQFFLSVNVCVGQIFIFLFIIFEMHPFFDGLFNLYTPLYASIILIASSIIVTCFRYQNAKDAICGEVRSKQKGKGYPQFKIY